MPVIKVEIDSILLTALQALAGQQGITVAGVIRQLTREATQKGKAPHDISNAYSESNR
jgi:hypothetical protein